MTLINKEFSDVLRPLLERGVKDIKDGFLLQLNGFKFSRTHKITIILHARPDINGDGDEHETTTPTLMVYCPPEDKNEDYLTELREVRLPDYPHRHQRFERDADGALRVNESDFASLIAFIEEQRAK
jgi:hypothetical protein